MPRILYLDQNKWIELARVFHGRDKTVALRDILDELFARVRDGTLVVPLSSVHYMELFRVSNREQRNRLGQFMWELSRGAAIETSEALVLHELDLALASFFPMVKPRPFSLLGFGVAFAFGMPERRFRAPPAAIARNPERDWTAIEARMSRRMERAMLTDTSAEGGAELPYRDRTHSSNFMDYLDKLSIRYDKIDPAKREDVLFAVQLLDIKIPLEKALARNGIAFEQLAALGKDALSAFVGLMPSRRLTLHLHRQYLKNPALRARITDLEDWAGLVPATMYCDALVCEKHFAALVERDRFEPHARVLRASTELAQWLPGAAAPA